MYEFVSKKIKTWLNKECLDIIHEIQDLLRNKITFDIKLVGSGSTNLVTINGNKFDLDYNLIIKHDYDNLINNNPEYLRNLFVEALNKVRDEFNIRSIRNSTSVITCLFDIDGMQISFDLAIVCEDDDRNLYKLVFDKKSNNFIWNKIANIEDMNGTLRDIKNNGDINEFRERYLQLKNIHLKRMEERDSFSVFLETINEFKNRY